MREALGGTLLTYIVLFFLAVYIAFMAIVINYAKVYKMKNEVVSYIENSEGVASNANMLEIFKMMYENGYPNGMDICYTNGKNNSVYYSIRLYMAFSLPLVDNKIEVPVNGETSAIKLPKDFDPSKGIIKECGVGGSKFSGPRWGGA